MPCNGSEEPTSNCFSTKDGVEEQLLKEFEREVIEAERVGLSDLLRQDALQDLQRSFHAATGYSLTITGQSGQPVCELVEMAPACQIVLFGTEQGRRRCHACRLRLTLECIRNRLAVVTKCHADFLSAAAPVIVKGQALGAVIVGPGLAPAPKRDIALDFARAHNLSPKAYWGAVKKLNVTDYETIESMARFMAFTVGQMAELLQDTTNGSKRRCGAAITPPPALGPAMVFKRYFESALDGVALLVNSLFTEVNPVLGRMLGAADHRDLLGKDICDFMPPVQPDGSSTKDLTESIKKRVRGGQPLRHTMQARRQDGSLFWVESTLVLLGEDPAGPVLMICRDVSDRMAALAEAAQQRNILQVTFDGISEAALLLDRNGIVLLANKALARRLHTTPQALKGTKLSDHMTEAMARSYLERLEQAFVSGKVQTFEDQWGESTMDYRLCPINGEDGQSVTAVACLGVDVTEARRSESELRKLTTAVEQARTGVMIQSDEGLIEYVNPYLARISGYSREELAGLHPFDLVIQPERNALQAALYDRFAVGRTWRGELCIRKKSGEIAWLNAAVSPVLDESGTLRNYVSLLEDSTEQKLMDDMLWHSLAEFDAIFNNTAAAIMHLKNGVLSKVNASFTDLFGYSRREVRRRPISFLFPSRREFEEFEARYGPKLQAGEVVKVEQALRRKDGTIFWCSLSGKAVLPSSLEHGLIWIADDISQRRELETLREDVERIMRHDLKSPLNALINLPRLVADDPSISEESQEMLTMIEEMGYHMLQQVNLSLEIYKIETGTFRLMPEPVDLCRVMQRLAKEMSLRLTQREALLDIKSKGYPLDSAEPFMVLGEETFCHTVFANLLENAVDATPLGGIVAVRMELGRFGEITVHNQGPVPADIRETFFDKYVTLGKQTGTGLGTYSARLLVRAMGGDISMRTSDMEGTTLTVRLPLLSSAQSV